MSASPLANRELVIERVLDASAEKLFRCWTDPKLLVQWFAPKPWTTASAELDVRPGGASLVVMRSPEGEDMPCPGVYLEVVLNKRLVFTDGYTAGWVPVENPFFTGILTFEDLGNGKTRYTARARHWSEEACKRHAEMGFEAGWNQCADQLEALARTL